MVEKRKASTRAKSEAPAKRRASAQIVEDSKEIAVSEPIAIKLATNSLPTKISEGKPLPTLSEPQPLDLPNKEYQPVGQSGVLAESLKRSRNKWLSEGIFERYWTKPSKSKNVAAPENNPDTKSMQPVGPCRLTIEPHVFDARLFIVKDPATLNQPHKQIFPPHRPVMQYGPPNGVVVTPSLPLRASHHHSPYQQTPQTLTSQPQQFKASPAIEHQNRTLPPLHSSPTSQSPQATQPPYNQISPKVQNHKSSSHITRTTEITNGNLPSSERSKQNPALPNPNINGVVGRQKMENNMSPSTTEPKPDPVIHALAKKASSDPQLTSLMRTVASGQATEEQLKIFQRHIDGLSAVLSKQKEEKAQTAKASTSPTMNSRPAVSKPVPTPATPVVHGNSQAPTSNGISNKATPAHSPHQPSPTPLRPHHSTSSSSQPQAYYQSNPPLSKASNTASPRGPDTRDVLIEFEKNGDRFLFPRYSILEYLPNCNVVIASFLIVRRGSTANSNSNSQASSKTKAISKSNPRSSSTPNLKAEPTETEGTGNVNAPIYDPSLDYYQPVTVRFSSDDAKVLSVLQQAVAPPEEVRRYMDDVMDKMTRAEYVYLAMRLPRPDEGDVEDIDGVVEDGTPGVRDMGDGAGRVKKVVRIE